MPLDSWIVPVDIFIGKGTVTAVQRAAMQDSTPLGGGRKVAKEWVLCVCLLGIIMNTLRECEVPLFSLPLPNHTLLNPVKLNLIGNAAN